jgi:hypothetical protein
VVEEADDKGAKKKRGPKGAIKHTPGRDHARKSAQSKRKRFERKATKKRKNELADLRRQWEVWDALSADARSLRPELKPKGPRPTDETETAAGPA